MRVENVNRCNSSPKFGSLSLGKGGPAILQKIEKILGKEDFSDYFTRACDTSAQIEMYREPKETVISLVGQKKVSSHIPNDAIDFADKLANTFKRMVKKAEEITSTLKANIDPPNTDINLFKPSKNINPRAEILDNGQTIYNNRSDFLPEFKDVKSPKDLYKIAAKLVKEGRIISEYPVHLSLQSAQFNPFRVKKLIENGNKYYGIIYDWNVDHYKIQYNYCTQYTPIVTVIQMRKDTTGKFASFIPELKFEATDFIDRNGKTKHIITNYSYDDNGYIQYAENLVDGTVVGTHKFNQEGHNWGWLYFRDRAELDSKCFPYIKDFDEYFNKLRRGLSNENINVNFREGKLNMLDEIYNNQDYDVNEILFTNQTIMPRIVDNSHMFVYTNPSDNQHRYLLAFYASLKNYNESGYLNSIFRYNDKYDIVSRDCLALLSEDLYLFAREIKYFEHIHDPNTMSPNLFNCEIPIRRPLLVEDLYDDKGRIKSTNMYLSPKKNCVLYEGSFKPDLAPTDKTRLYYLPRATICPLIRLDNFYSNYLKAYHNLAIRLRDSDLKHVTSNPFQNL